MKKLQLSSSPTILGVTYNLDQMQLEIKGDRREEISTEIDAILKSVRPFGSRLSRETEGQADVWFVSAVGKSRPSIPTCDLRATVSVIPYQA